MEEIGIVLHEKVNVQAYNITVLVFFMCNLN